MVLLEGPATSAGGVHLGPAYYYLLALPMLVDWLDPLADAVLMALLGAATVGIVFVLARRWFGLWPALAAAGLYAISPAAIVASRSAWNPAPAPFFVCLALLGLDGAWRSGNGRGLLVVGLGLGFLIQLHYFALAIVLVALLFSALLVRRHQKLATWAVAGLAVFVALQMPLLVHEVLTGFPNVEAAATLAGGGAVIPVQVSAPRRIYEVFSLGLVGTFAATNVEVVAAVVSLVVVAGLCLGLARYRTLQFPQTLIAALLVGTVAQAVLVYRGPIFEHYYVPVAPVLYLGLAAALSRVPSVPFAQLAAGASVLGLTGLNLLNSPLRAAPDHQLADTQTVAQWIADAAGSEPFELWLIAGGESDGAYRFWLERLGRPPSSLDGPAPAQLFIICRTPVCDPARAQEEAGQEWSGARVTWRARLAADEVMRLLQAR